MDKKKEEQRIIVAPHRHVLLSLCYHCWNRDKRTRAGISRSLPGWNDIPFPSEYSYFLLFVSMINLWPVGWSFYYVETVNRHDEIYIGTSKGSLIEKKKKKWKIEDICRFFDEYKREIQKIVVYIDSNTRMKRGSWMSRKLFFHAFHIFWKRTHRFSYCSSSSVLWISKY